MSIAMRLTYRVERDAPLVTRMPVTLLMQGDEAANEIVVEMLDGGAPMNLSGYSAALYLRRADGQRVRNPGSVTGNAASVTLDAACYSVPGSYIASMILSADGEDRTVLRLAGYVESDGEGPVIDPAGEIPGYDDLARAYAELEAAIKAAETATEAASDAAEEAGNKAEAAETAAGAANRAAAAAAQSAGLADTAARNASAAAASANAAAQKIEGMTVSASGLEEGSQPTAAISEQDGAKHIAFGIPAGATGPKGDTGATPDLSIGEVTTGAPGTQAAAAITGTAEAPVLNLTIPRGDAGEGDVSSVDSILPGDDGDVALSAVRYAAQTLEDEQKVQARKNIGVDGQVYPCTAQALEAMSQEQQAELYVQGYRAIQTKNNETVVTLALAADGGLQWQGCNQDRTNLLDNPNFSVAQAGYGGTHGAQVYAADRWEGSGTGATFAAGSGGGLSITCGTGAAECSQVVADPPAVGAYFSFVVVSGNTAVIASGTWTGTGQDATKTSGALTASVNAGSAQISVASGSATVDYCMLLIGSYTPKTLPPWEDIDSVVNLIRCRDYYRSLSAYGFVGIAVADTTNSVQGVIFGDSMRIYNPSMLGTFVVFTPTASTSISSFQSVSYQGNGFRFIAQTTGGISIGTVGFLVPSPENGAISADM